MATKICWIDVETTGLQNWKHDIIQIAGMIDINGQIVDTFNFNCKPFNWDDITPKALEVNGVTMDQLMMFPDPHEIQTALEDIFNTHVDRFNKGDKFYFGGYNASFDDGFVDQFWKKCGAKFYRSYFEYKLLDVLPLSIAYAQAFAPYLPNHRLETMANHLNIEINAHDALSDIQATREIYLYCMELMKEGKRVLDMVGEEEEQ